MKQPTIAQKYLALSIVLPTIADFIEDLRDTNVFKHSLAQKANLLMNEIRRADSKFYERGSFSEDMTEEEYQSRIKAIANQQSEGGNSFRLWISQEIFDPYATSTVHSDNKDQGKKKARSKNNSKG